MSESGGLRLFCGGEIFAEWREYSNFAATETISATMTQTSLSAPAKGRDASISIAKAVAIILMVIGHSEYPGLLTSCLYTFHMPLFFITAGYFFGRRNADNPWEFCRRRFKGLYVPMVKWSLVWLLLHNIFHHAGILNEKFGNWEGGVTHPYTLADGANRAVQIFTQMGGYDEFMAGAFWFFRGLLVASVLFLVFFRVADSRTQLKEPWHIALLICGGALLFTAAHIYLGFKINALPGGGWREIWGLFFFGIGVVYRRWESKVADNPVAALMCLLLIVMAGSLHWSGMNNVGRYRDLWTLPLTGIAGFIMVHYTSRVIARRGSWLSRLLVFIGDNTLYILVFHIISFKVVSAVKIWWYGLDPAQIGCHMVIHDYQGDWFWIAYSIAGVALPLTGITLWRLTAAALRKRFNAPVGFLTAFRAQ